MIHSRLGFLSASAPMALLVLLGAGCGQEDRPELRWKGWPIIGGVRDTSPEHLGVVGLQMSTPDGIYMCTGTLINRFRVLTAAHCVNDVTNARNIEVDFGPSVFMAIDRLTASASYIHPSYNAHTQNNDIAMVILGEPAPEEAPPIPFLRASEPVTQSDVGKTITFVGFGVSDGVNGTGDGFKNTVDKQISYVCDNSNGCTFTYGGAWQFEQNPYTIGYVQNGSGTCFGDSGGPALLVRDGHQHVISVNSTVLGEFCEYIGFATKVDRFESFINQHNGAASGTACATDPECESGYCIEGICCSSACLDACQSCTQPGAIGRCLPKTDGNSCSDRDVCNGEEVCQGGVCQPGTPLECQDQQSCTKDGCDPVLGCVYTPQALECYDGNSCTKDVCDASLGCTYPHVADGTSCGPKGQFCDYGRCIAAPSSGCATGGSGPGCLFMFLLLAFATIVLLRLPRR